MWARLSSVQNLVGRCPSHTLHSVPRMTDPQYPAAYLARVPGPRGDSSVGEIEILTDEDAVRGVMRDRSARLEQQSEHATADQRTGVGVVFEDEYVLVVRDAVRFPSGTTGTYLRILPRPALDGAIGVVLLPVLEGRILLRRVFRHATRAWELECPRGFREPSRTALEAVHQETAEEVGAAIANVRTLGQICADTGLIAGCAEAFLVELAGEPGDAAPEASEAFGEMRRYTAPQLLEAIGRGDIRDSFTLSAISLALARGWLSE